MIKLFLSATFFVSFLGLDTVEGMRKRGYNIVPVSSSSAIVKSVPLERCSQETTKTKRTAPIVWNTSSDSDSADLGPLFKTGLKDSDIYNYSDDNSSVVAADDTATVGNNKTENFVTESARLYYNPQKEISSKHQMKILKEAGTLKLPAQATNTDFCSRSKNSNNNLPKETPPAKTAVAPRSKTSTAVNSPKPNAQKVNIYSGSLLSNSNNNLQNKTLSTTTKPTAAILPRTSTNNNTSRSLNSNTGNNNRSLETSANRATIQPTESDTQTTSQKNSSYKYKTNESEIRTTPKKNTPLSPTNPTPAIKMKIKEKLPAPLPDPEPIPRDDSGSSFLSCCSCSIA